MQRTRIKFCGITRQQDAEQAVNLGVDALGFMFYQPSARYITPAKAQVIIQALPPFVMPVGVFVNPTRAEVTEILQQIPLALLQFHGDETPDFCNSFQLPYIKAVAMREGIDLGQITTVYATAKALLLDAYHPQLRGGTGQSFAWHNVPSALSLPIILSGGLNANNVASAINLLKPYAVDVSSGIEQAPGIKNLEKMREFVNSVIQGS